jgi:hypothetical protein
LGFVTVTCLGASRKHEEGGDDDKSDPDHAG